MGLGTQEGGWGQSWRGEWLEVTIPPLSLQGEDSAGVACAAGTVCAWGRGEACPLLFSDLCLGLKSGLRSLKEEASDCS